MPLDSKETDCNNFVFMCVCGEAGAILNFCVFQSDMIFRIKWIKSSKKGLLPNIMTIIYVKFHCMYFFFLLLIFSEKKSFLDYYNIYLLQLLPFSKYERPTPIILNFTEVWNYYFLVLITYEMTSSSSQRDFTYIQSSEPRPVKLCLDQ